MLESVIASVLFVYLSGSNEVAQSCPVCGGMEGGVGWRHPNYAPICHP